jgi:S-adenosylmethionine:tRNA ribosyltransferase-isomerase
MGQHRAIVEQRSLRRFRVAGAGRLAHARPAVGPEAFDYDLPPDQIAQQPAERRGDARMLVLGDPLVHARARELPQHLPEGALVVVNASGVVPARLHATRADGRVFELLLCAPGPGQGPGARLRAWVRGAKKLNPADVVAVGGLSLRYEEPDAVDPRARWFEVVEGDVLQACEAHGQTPLPPYIERATGPDSGDRDRYQTVYAGPRGSVAAPTAGLHFDEVMLDRLDPVRLVLHVGPGTFLPMDVDDVRQHKVGSERFSLDEQGAARIEQARREGRPIVAVGTTVTRTLESLGRAGAIRPQTGETDLVITPGFPFSVVTHLLTNFHLPRSSLLMLVSSFAGHDRVMAAYRTAVTQGYRFYSYGDCMLSSRE